jgi:tetratricopeptide (TPR) repeat protein
MQVVIPYQNHDWKNLHAISKAWTISQPNTADAWFFLGVADFELDHLPIAKTELEKALSLNPKNLDVLIKQSEIAFKEVDLDRLDKLNASIAALDSYAAEELAKKITMLKQTKQTKDGTPNK